MPIVTEAQIFLTRKCNQHCPYCILTTKKEGLGKELTLEEWKHAFDTMQELGVETVKVLGGEPTVKEDIIELIKHLNKNGLEYAILSNSIRLEKDPTFLEEFLLAQPTGYFASIDWVPGMEITDDDIYRKSERGLKILNIFKKEGIKILGANCVVNSRNLIHIPLILATLFKKGIWMNICTEHYANVSKESKEMPWIYRSDDSEFKLTKELKPTIEKTMETLKSMKHNGKLLATPDSYLENFSHHGVSHHGVDLNWHCSVYSQLRIDADGALIICPDLRGKTSEKFNIKQMNKGKYEQFIEEWHSDPIREKCPGCYWSSMYRAEENLDKRGEFSFINDKNS